MNDIKRKGKRHRNNERSFFEEFRFEMTVFGLFASGVFLLLEKMEIKHTIWSGVKIGARFIADSLTGLLTGTVNIIKSVETSDLIGILLILFAGGMVMDRVRLRMIDRMSRPDVCPKCNGQLHRIHRKLKHRLLEVPLGAQIKHYTCKKCSNTVITATRKERDRRHHHA